MKNRSYASLVIVVLLVCLPLASALSRDSDSSPVQHCVLLRINKDAPSRETMVFLRKLSTIWEEIPGIVGLQWGTDNSPEGLQRGFTHACIMSFESPAALETYGPHPVHVALKERGKGIVDDVFVFDFAVPEVPPPDVPGRVHHLVFFQFKSDTTAAKIAEIEKGFSELPMKIPGTLRYQAGQELNGGPRSQGMTHGYVLTFLNQDARDDYLPHPAHGAFVDLVKEHLEGVVVVDFTVRPSGRSLLVTDGIEPFRVYQRDGEDSADMEFRGLAGDDGPIEARILRGRRVIDGFDWAPVGRAERGVFSARLDDVPTGGEYTVEVRRRDGLGNVAEWTAVSNVLVGDVWILAGQSNMEGYGRRAKLEEPNDLVHCFTMAQRWELAVEPLHWRIESRDPVHLYGRLTDKDEDERRVIRARRRKERTSGAGLGLTFAKDLVEHTGVPIGLIASAHGGSSMESWSPERRDENGQSLYGSMFRQVQRAGGKVRGVLWYQGESDVNEEAAPLFASRFARLIVAFRQDFKDSKLPFYYVQIGRHVRDEANLAWKQVQEAQRLAVNDIPHTAVVSSIDMRLDDAIHASTEGVKRLGRRLAKRVRRDLFGHSSLETGPRLADARLVNPYTIAVRFTGVNSELVPADRILGFSLASREGRASETLVFRAERDAEDPQAVILRLTKELADGDFLWYGAGLNPTCNLVDTEDLAALAFGPIQIER